MKEYDTYLLDFDGTLFDSKESLRPVFRQGFGKLGIEVTDEECEVFMHHTLLQSAQMKNVPESRFRELLEAITIALDSEESLSLIKPFSDTVYLISELKRRKKRLKKRKPDMIPKNTASEFSSGAASFFAFTASADDRSFFPQQK